MCLLWVPLIVLVAPLIIVGLIAFWAVVGTAYLLLWVFRGLVMGANALIASKGRDH